jgi:hypothetical protein
MGTHLRAPLQLPLKVGGNLDDVNDIYAYLRISREMVWSRIGGFLVEINRFYKDQIRTFNIIRLRCSSRLRQSGLVFAFIFNYI